LAERAGVNPEVMEDCAIITTRMMIFILASLGLSWR